MDFVCLNALGHGVKQVKEMEKRHKTTPALGQVQRAPSSNPQVHMCLNDWAVTVHLLSPLPVRYC